MSIQVSPSVNITERDLTNIIPAVSSSVGASVVGAQWGPIGQPLLVNSENKLVEVFGKPTTGNAGNWFPIAQFLSYSGACYVTRTKVAGALNATSGTVGILIESPDTFELDTSGISAGVVDHGMFAAKYAGEMGQSIGVSVCDSAATFATWPFRGNFSGPPGTSSYIGAITKNVPGATGTGGTFTGANDEMHIVVYDIRGTWTGTPGAVLESYAFVSKASNAKGDDNASNFYKTVINNRSKMVWALDLNSSIDPLFSNASDVTPDPLIKDWSTQATGPTNSANEVGTAMSYDSLLAVYTRDFKNGAYDTTAVTVQNKVEALRRYQSAEEIDVSLIFLGEAERAVVIDAISNLAETRKDCLVFITPTKLTADASVLGAMITDRDVNAAQLTVEFKIGGTVGATLLPALPSSSYTVYDSGYKYIYDSYNDTYRWIPMNGDIAGLCARTDRTDDPWFSPAGFTRGQIKNAIRLAYGPALADRDVLYLQGINPVVSFTGQGVVLFGDKTGLSKPSAFDRINVRRLFIILEKAIATAAKYQLFELNDAFTRTHFKNMVEPFLRDVQGRRGLYEFKVVCDESNNTPEVIDTNRFVGDIFIKPAKSINFIQLNFIATRTGASFEESISANANS